MEFDLMNILVPNFLDILIRVFLLLFIYRSIKFYKKIKELETDNENLLRQLEVLTHENNVLKKRDADMI